MLSSRAFVTDGKIKFRRNNQLLAALMPLIAEGAVSKALKRRAELKSDKSFPLTLTFASTS
jgi:hypothetical protein